MTKGERIRAARKSAHLTQKELGARLGVAYQTVAQWENNLRNPKQETLQRIADALGCDFYFLLLGEQVSIEERSAFNVMRLFDTVDPRIQKAAQVAVHYSESVHKAKGYSFSGPEMQLISSFSSLNEIGQKIAVERLMELAEIPKYQRQPEEGEQVAVDPQEDN